MAASNAALATTVTVYTRYFSGSSLAQAKAAVNVLRVNMSDARITSPINGVVTNRNINPGEMAAPTSPLPLLTIADASTLKLQGTVGQEVVPLLATGQKVTVTLDALPGQEFTGTVTQVGPVAAATGQRFPVEISLPNPGNLKAGMTARASFQLTAPEGIVVPIAAVRTDNDQDYVFVELASQVAVKATSWHLAGLNVA